MGLHNLPPGYDAWRTTPPWDTGKRVRGTPDTVTQPLYIEAGEISIDATGEYDAETGALVTVQINGADRAVHEVTTMLASFAPRHTGAWDADLDDATLDRLISEAISDFEDDRADHQRDMRDDH